MEDQTFPELPFLHIFCCIVGWFGQQLQIQIDPHCDRAALPLFAHKEPRGASLPLSSHPFALTYNTARPLKQGVATV